jgi:hypothetical protein
METTLSRRSRRVVVKQLSLTPKFGMTSLSLSIKAECRADERCALDTPCVQ